jgi:SAM-dependent methyltransferase
MTEESVKEFYNRQYSLHREKRIDCPNALHDLDKANRRVAGVVRGFGLARLAGRKALDVGSGLGFYTKALAVAGADVTGVDFSAAAVDAGRETFPDCRFEYGAWPDDIEAAPIYDVIWMVNFSLMNTFDVGFIKEALVEQAMQRLTPGGTLVVGWNSNFSGDVIGGYSHWPLKTIAALRSQCGLSAPLVTEAGSLFASWFLIRAARVIGRSIPIFMVRRKNAA